MRINFDRICKLAGIPADRRSLNEGSRLNWHEDPNLRPEADVQYAKGKDPQLFEGEDSKKQMDELGYYKEGGHDQEKADEGYHSKETSEATYDEGHGHMGMMKMRDEGHGGVDHMMDEDIDEMDHEVDEKDDLDEMVEVDIAELMSEIRRAKKIMKLKESRRAQQIKKQKLQESHLKRIIQQEVQNIISEMQDKEDYDQSWVYGNRRPRHSRKGYTAQGSTIPGIGFKK